MRVLNSDTLEKVAQYNIDYQREHGRTPSFREIMHALNLGSLATVQRYVKALQKSDRLELTSTGNILP
jgi:SOS-response transcriptional repressor LexA